MAYCLADGIYPNWAVFIKTLAQPRGNKQKNLQQYKKLCEKIAGVRRSPSPLEDFSCSVQAALTVGHGESYARLYNTPQYDLEENRTSDVDEHIYLFDESNENPVYELKVTRPVGFRPRSIGELMTRINSIENATKHVQLQADLIEHIWSCFGDETRINLE
ncbi:LOW QUALITY PROTEIN: hypothetical protein PHMEG_00030163 [Phytophthora megakarya]|uniref:Uncharacterized protein n=1 Tax=Phytophthora megakarya TaxID=4795 RepID=A0A225V0W8_9STRA|nr:LOW QUALITY PROTEIN: hypothetical protein PHMEG_00030163 [Phytophthora megakarya]